MLLGEELRLEAVGCEAVLVTQQAALEDPKRILWRVRSAQCCGRRARHGEHCHAECVPALGTQECSRAPVVGAVNLQRQVGGAEGQGPGRVHSPRLVCRVV